MKGALGLIVVLIALVVVGLLAKNRLDAPGGATSTVVPGTDLVRPSGPPAQQVEQMRQQVETLVQQPRPIPGDESLSK